MAVGTGRAGAGAGTGKPGAAPPAVVAADACASTGAGSRCATSERRKASELTLGPSTPTSALTSAFRLAWPAGPSKLKELRAAMGRSGDVKEREGEGSARGREGAGRLSRAAAS
jgi:hypothetical protein